MRDDEQAAKIRKMIALLSAQQKDMVESTLPLPGPNSCPKTETIVSYTETRARLN